MVLVRWGVIYERRQGMQRIEYRYKCPTVVRGRQSSPTTFGFGIKPTHRGIWLPVLATHTNQSLVYNTESARDGPPVIDQLNGCMSAPFQTRGVPLLLFV